MSDTTNVVRGASNVSCLDSSRTLRLENTTAPARDRWYVRVKSTTCTTNCAVNDVYNLRAFDTT